MGYTGYGKWPKKWARDDGVGRNGDNLMIVNIVFHWNIYEWP